MSPGPLSDRLKKMSKRSNPLPLFFLLNAFLSLPPAPQVYADTAWTKLGRGFCNTAFGWVEIFYQVGVLSKTERWPIAVAGGLPKGILYGVLRTAVGVYELATFPVPLPEHYRPIMEPEFVIPVE